MTPALIYYGGMMEDLGTFMGKPVNDMDRDGLLEVIKFLIAESEQYKNKHRSLFKLSSARTILKAESDN